jgi:glycine/D-amino acid oxidase-like deaminating enzyme
VQQRSARPRLPRTHTGGTDDPVVVVGGGVMGLLTAFELAKQDVPVVLVDEPQLGGYSSTRNQGWLQGGAYYAVRNDPVAALACKEGYERLWLDVPELISSEIPCQLLFESEEERDLAVSRCSDLAIACDPLSDAEMKKVVETNPLLRASPLRYGATSADHPIDTTAILTRFANRAARSGVRFRSVPAMRDVRLERLGERWRISLGDGASIDSSFVVVACGPMLPAFVSDVHPELQSRLEVTKVAVLSLAVPTASFPAMLIAPNADQGPNVVPFRTTAGAGITICLAGTDVTCDERGASDRALPLDARGRFGIQLAKRFPALGRMATEADLTGYIYVCHKLKPKVSIDALASRERTLDLFIDPNSGAHLLSVYPGKFTAGPTVAVEAAAMIATRYPARLHGGQPPNRSEIPPVAQQPYTDENWLRLTALNGALYLEDR